MLYEKGFDVPVVFNNLQATVSGMAVVTGPKFRS